jgi:hypothetical protein
VRLLIETNNEEIIKKIKSLLLSHKGDETNYLLSSDANEAHLEQAILQDKQGKSTVKNVDDLWK